MPDTANDAGDAKPRGGSPMVRLMVAAGFLLLVVGAELAVAFFVFPSADDVQAMAQGTQPAHHDEAELPDVPEGGSPHNPDEEHAEVDLGEFSVSAYQPLSNTTLRIDFQVYGVVLADDLPTFEKLLEENKHRLREQVLVIMRSAEMSDLTDAGLGLIKRKILEKTNRSLGKALLQEVLFSDFSFVEQ